MFAFIPEIRDLLVIQRFEDDAYSRSVPVKELQLRSVAIASLALAGISPNLGVAHLRLRR